MVVCVAPEWLRFKELLCKTFVELDNLPIVSVPACHNAYSLFIAKFFEMRLIIHTRKEGARVRHEVKMKQAGKVLASKSMAMRDLVSKLKLCTCGRSFGMFCLSHLSYLTVTSCKYNL